MAKELSDYDADIDESADSEYRNSGINYDDFPRG